jgi:WD repeat-containing protein 35
MATNNTGNFRAVIGLLWSICTSMIDSFAVVQMIVRGGQTEMAIDCCMELNHWDKAVKLAKKHDRENIVESAIMKYTKYLLQSGNLLHAVDVYRKGGQHLNAAKVLNQLARQMAAKKVHFFPLLISV